MSNAREIQKIQDKIIKTSPLYREVRQRIREDLQDYELFSRQDNLDKTKFPDGFSATIDFLPNGGGFLEHCYVSLVNNLYTLEQLEKLGEDNSLIRYSEEEWLLSQKK